MDIPKKMDPAERKEVAQEIRRLEEVEYGIKEFISGLLVGVILGFILAMFLLK